MKTKRQRITIDLTDDAKRELQSITSSRSLPHTLVRRAQIILMVADKHSNTSVSKHLHVSGYTVWYWRKRYHQYGLTGLYDELRSGRPRSIADEKVAQIVSETLHSQPQKPITHWTVRSLANKTNLSKTTIHRIWQAFGLQPHRQKHFKLSTDPFFVDKVRDIVGLYLNPPEKALVLCVDEKTQIQALDRTQPMLPLGLGYAEGVTHDYERHGTTTLFAALDIANGTVINQCKSRHRTQEFLQFLNHIDQNVPADMDIHLVLDNYATHKHDRVKRWLATRSRYHIHYTPTYASWLNQVEIWFNIITQRAIRRGTFSSVKELIDKIKLFVENYNKHCSPFTWTATADSILQKVERLCKRISGTAH